MDSIVTKLWSHSFAQSVVHLDTSEAKDARELLSRRWGNGILLLLPLSSGKVAIFSSSRELLALVAEAPTLDELRSLSEQSAVAARTRIEATLPPLTTRIKASLSDLDL